MFKWNYYFVLVDNRKNFDDCRINGFVPEQKVIGKI
ncbi:S26 family signal peptidase [Pedobacter lithocola]|uniref:S26 family signal peptidase n=1 Tax=Pedobacter lithocola TaxID=1908239 RepID=A0ABV8P507_9SPHI